jgi:AI-2 transport protein TqsA
MTRGRSGSGTVAGMPEPQVSRVLPLWLLVLLGVAAAGGALSAVHAARWLLGPVILAFVLTVVAHPLIGALVGRGMRRGLAVAVAAVLVDGVLIGFAFALALSFAQLATVLPQYSEEWQGLVDDVRSAMTSLGIGPDQVKEAVSSIQLSTVVSALGGLLARLGGSVAALVLVLATVVFMTAEAAGLPERLAGAPGSGRLGTALGDFARNTRRYIVVTTIFGFLVAVVDTVALVLLGVPLAFLWGLLSFLTNYVPNIGFFLGLAPPVLLALLVGGPQLALIVVLVYSLANFVLQTILQPVFVGDAVGLSVTLTFLSVLVWTVVLGPIGAVLAIPLTLFAQQVLVGQDPEREWARRLLAGTSAAAPAEGQGKGHRPGKRHRTHDRSGHPDDEPASSVPDDAGPPQPREAEVVEQVPGPRTQDPEAERPSAGGSP